VGGVVSGATALDAQATRMSARSGAVRDPMWSFFIFRLP
jgi:hypothetical protein